MTSVLEYFIMIIKPKNGHVWYCEYLILQYWHPSVMQQTSGSCAQRTFRPPSHPRAQLFPHTQLFLLGCAHIIPPVSTIWSMTSLTAQHWLFSAALVCCCCSSCEFWTCVGVRSEPLAVSLSAGPDLTFISSARAALMWAKMKDQMRAAMTSLLPLNPGEVITAIFCNSTNQHDIKMIPRTISFGSRRRRHNDTKLCWIQLCLRATGVWLESKTGHLTFFLREEMKHPGQPKEKPTIPHQANHIAPHWSHDTDASRLDYCWRCFKLSGSQAALWKTFQSDIEILTFLQKCIKGRQTLTADFSLSNRDCHFRFKKKKKNGVTFRKKKTNVMDKTERKD